MREVWTRDCGRRPCCEEVVVREMTNGYYGEPEVTVECEGITDHDGPHFSMDVGGYLITFEPAGQGSDE